MEKVLQIAFNSENLTLNLSDETLDKFFKDFYDDEKKEIIIMVECEKYYIQKNKISYIKTINDVTEIEQIMPHVTQYSSYIFEEDKQKEEIKKHIKRLEAKYNKTIVGGFKNKKEGLFMVFYEHNLR